MQRFSPFDKLRTSPSFTLIELLIVIGILAVLATVVVLVINPAELFKQGRDSTRVSDLRTLNTALTLADLESLSPGNANTVYVSIPDSDSGCANLGLPSLPAGYTYGCSTSTNYRKVDGTGWIPVAFTSIIQGSPLSQLPIDPVNATSTGNYYTYVTGGSWELGVQLEASKSKIGGSEDKVSTDGGDNPIVYETGSDMALDPRKVVQMSSLQLWLDPSRGITLSGSDVSQWEDQSGNGHTAVSALAPTFSAAGPNGYPVLQFRADYMGIDDSFILKDLYFVYKSPNSVFNNYGATVGTVLGAERTIMFTISNTTFWVACDAAYKNGVSLAGTWDMAPITNYMVISARTCYPNSSRQYQIGASETGYRADLDIVEILGYDTVLSDGDREAVEAYLNHKYDIF